METPKNCVLTSYRFPDHTPDELGEKPDLTSAFKLESKWFNEKGQLVKQEDYDADGGVNETFEYRFNDQGLISSYTHFIDGSLSEKAELEYNEAGEPVLEIKHFVEGGVQRTRYTYSAEGQLLTKEITDEDGTPEGSEENVWEEKNLISRKVRDLGMDTGEDFTMKYKKVGERWEIEEELHTEFPSGVKYRTVYSSNGYITYDEKGSRYASHKKVVNDKDQILESHYSSMQRDMSVYFMYNDEGKMVEEKRMVGDNLNYLAKISYYENGRVKMAHVTEASSGTFTDLFFYDNSDQAS